MTLINGHVLSDLTLSAVQAEAIRAHVKHGENSLLNPGIPSGLKLAALMEEVGEVAHELTYDTEDNRDNLVKELIQVANVALSWVESLEGHAARNAHREPEPQSDDELPGMWSTSDYTGGPDDATSERLRDAYEYRTGDDS